MYIAILAPSPVPFLVGGAEKLWQGLYDYVRTSTSHRIELIKIPVRDRDFPGLMAGYRAFFELDLSRFDFVISTKYPAWAARHPAHILYLQHKLRGLYDTYPAGFGLDLPLMDGELKAVMECLVRPPDGADALSDILDSVDAALRSSVAPAFSFPGPLTRSIVHYIDKCAINAYSISRFAAISSTVTKRADYFPKNVNAVNIYHPSNLIGLGDGPFGYFFTASRLEGPKRVALLIDAMKFVHENVQLYISGSGPEEASLKQRAASDKRIQFLGFISDRELVDRYKGALAVPFVPEQEDYGLITIEAMLCGKPVITAYDSGGPTEFVDDGITGFVCPPDARAIGAAMQKLACDHRLARDMGSRAQELVKHITWPWLFEQLTKDVFIQQQQG